MKNKKFTDDWGKLSISEDTENRMFDKIQQKLQSHNKKTYKFRYFLVAICAVTLVFMLSAFAPYMGKIIENLKSANFNANKFDKLISSYDGANINTSVMFEITDPNIKKQQVSGSLNLVNGGTIDEAKQNLAFTPKELKYLPEGFYFQNTMIFKDSGNNEYYQNECNLRYGNDVLFFTLSEQYVGENAQIQIDTTSDIEKITLHDETEALLTIGKCNNDYEIYWIKDGIGYSLWGFFERDDIIKMAESVE